MIRSLIAGSLRVFSGSVARWQGCAPDLVQRIYFANHTSNLVGPVLWASQPALERKKPTSEANPLLEMVQAMGDRHSLILFPEGGRQTSPEPQPFKPRLYPYRARVWQRHLR
jgi:1-acyl-sn-glycerol-3-phosphate acyltransferase